MKADFTQKPERQYYIDWLRILLIMSVFLFHIGMVFNTWGWHIKNDQQFAALNYPMRFLHYWRMPLLFFISGAGTWFALGFKSTGEYLKERANRLLHPGARSGICRESRQLQLAHQLLSAHVRRGISVRQLQLAPSVVYRIPILYCSPLFPLHTNVQK